MKISATLKNTHNRNELFVKTNNDGKELIIPPKFSGYGSSVNGGELLFLSLAVCFCNDIYREANKKNIQVIEVGVEVSGDFGAEGEPASNIQYKAMVKANTSQQQIDELIRQTDKAAEIHNTLRKGVTVSLISDIS